MTKKCAIGPCERPASVGKLCQTCYNGIYYWTARVRATPTRIIERQHQLTVLRARLDLLTPANVVPLARKRRG